MGKLIKLAFVALLLFGLWQISAAQFDQFKFEDAVRQVAEFRSTQEEEDVRAAVVSEATRLGLKVDPARVSIHRAGEHIYIDVAYERGVQVLPWYRYNWPFVLKVEGWYVPGARAK
jgi:hypothetical protein